MDAVPRPANFRLFIAGQALSMFGNRVQEVGLFWLVYEATQSATLLGTMMFVGGLPIALLAPLVGTFADRASPLRLAIVMQYLLATQALLLGALVVAGEIEPAVILSLVCLQGILNGIDMPLRQILVPRLVRDRAGLSTGVALNAVAYDAMRIVGPVIGGLIAVAWGETVTFLVNGLAHVAAAAAFLAIRTDRPPAIAGGPGVAARLREGWRYAIASRPILAILLLSAVVAFAGSAYMTLLPVFASDILGGDARDLGALMGATGVGALLGAALFGLAKDISRHPRLIGAGAGLFGAGLAALSLATTEIAACLSLALAGFGIMVMMAACNTSLVGLTEADKQGRVLGLFTLSYAGAAPLGGLCAGALAAQIGAAPTIGASAVVGLVAALCFAPLVRRLEVLLRDAA